MKLFHMFLTIHLNIRVDDNINIMDDVSIVDELPQEDNNSEPQLHIVDRSQEEEGYLSDIPDGVAVLYPRRSKRLRTTS